MNRYDELMNRCPKLGGEVTFAYCRREQGDLPCARLVSCWPSLPLEDWLKKVLSPKALQSFKDQPAKSRIDTIFQTLESLDKKR